MRKIIKENRSTITWLGICILSVIISVFIHEIVHGVCARANGIAVSTGFNRVGNAYMFPSDPDFRTGLYFPTPTSLSEWDFAPVATLILAVIFTVTFVCKKYTNSIFDRFVFAFALSNSILRPIPVALALITGGVEDEITQGEVLAEIFDSSLLLYVPAMISIVIGGACIYFIYRRYLFITKQEINILSPFGIVPAFAISFVILNLLDNYLRINWVP